MVWFDLRLVVGIYFASMSTPPTSPSKISTVLKRRRAMVGLTAAQLGRIVDCNQVAIYEWEAGRQSPALASRQALYQHGYLPLGALTGSDADWDTYLKEPTDES
jgi:DNA-binding XRE family transcriptional regulator